jgi:uncharacterized protein (TIGR00369 family)
MTNAQATPMQRRRSPEEQARLDAALADLFERRITFNQTLGLVVESARSPEPKIRFAMRPELVGHFLHGRLHGGVISATLDAMGGFALMVAIGEKHADENTMQVLHRFAKMGTIDLRIDYLRPGVGEHFVASAEVTRLGGRIGSTQMRLANDQGVLIATGAAAYVVS